MKDSNLVRHAVFISIWYNKENVTELLECS